MTEMMMKDYMKYQMLFQKMKEQNKTINDYSIWNARISFDTLVSNINSFMDPEVPIYSFGSGDGRVEKYYNDQFDRQQIVCVEPEPGEFNRSTVVLEPKYSTVEELIEAKPELVGEAQALLIWVTPSLNYDMDVIKKLKPKKLLILYDGSGSAGSNDFHDYLGNECKDEYRTEQLLFEEHNRGVFGSDWNYYILKSFERI